MGPAFFLCPIVQRKNCKHFEFVHKCFLQKQPKQVESSFQRVDLHSKVSGDMTQGSTARVDTSKSSNSASEAALTRDSFTTKISASRNLSHMATLVDNSLTL